MLQDCCDLSKRLGSLRLLLDHDRNLVLRLEKCQCCRGSDGNAGGVQGFAGRGLAPEVQTDLVGMMTSDPEAGNEAVLR